MKAAINGNSVHAKIEFDMTGPKILHKVIQMRELDSGQQRDDGEKDT